jgi:hypothetical protein
VTPALGLLLTTSLLMAPPAKEEDPAARVQATMQRVSKLPPDHQRVWLLLVEQRYSWAVLLTLKEEDARLEQARVAKILRQKTVAWNELAPLLRQLDQREKAAIGRLVRQYRAEVYGTFDKRPRELVDRQEAWYRIWSLWEKAGSPPEQQDRLMDWLAAAIKASGQDSIRPLPPDPKFGEGVELVPEELVKRLTRPAPPPAEPADNLVPEMQARAPLPLRVPDSRRAIEPARQPPPRGYPAVAVRASERFDGDASLAPAPASMPPLMLPPSHVFPPLAAVDPRELTAPPAPRHVIAAMPRDPVTAVETSRDAVAKAEPPAQVNIEELGTRIEGINLSLRNLEGELHEKREFTVDQLDSLLSRLDILVLRQKDLTLFRNLVSPRDQAKVGQIDSPRPLVATMGTRIADARIHTRENQAAPESERTAALKHLDELSDRLATLTAEK